MAIVERPLTSPTILVTGTQILADGTTVVRTNYNVGTTYAGEPTSLTHTKKNVLVFQGTVRVTMSTTYPRSSRSTRPISNNQPMDLVHVGKLEKAEEGSKAEIVYTLNGKAPIRTRARYYQNAFDVKTNKSGSDHTVVKSRVYYQGKCSAVTQFVFRINKTAERTENNGVGN